MAAGLENGSAGGTPRRDGRSATEKLQDLQAEVNDLKRKEAELRALLAEVAGAAAAQHLARLEQVAPEDLPSGDAHALAQELGYVQRAKAYAQSLQELQGVLKHLERQLRAVERAATAGDLNAFLGSVAEAIASHNTVGEACERLAQLPVSGLPQLLQQHADAAVSRATVDQEKLARSLRLMLQSRLSAVGWPPPLAGSLPGSRDGQQQPPEGGSGSWQGFEAAGPEAVDWIVRLMAALLALQRSVQRASFDAGLASAVGEPPALWAVDALAAPLTERLRHHFCGNAATDRMDKPEWLFDTVVRLAGRLAAQTAPLGACLQAHGLGQAYHLPFEFVRALQTGMQDILRSHTLPRLAAAGQPGLWLAFAEKAAAFEAQLAPLRGLPRPPPGPAPALWRHRSCLELVCAVPEFREGWWGALREDGLRQLDEALALPTAWAPAHLAWDAALPPGWEEAEGEELGRGREAWRSEFWPPQAAETALSLVGQLASIAAWLPDAAVPAYAHEVPQTVLRQLRRRLEGECKRLEEFREEVSEAGAPQMGAALCAAHHLEHSLAEAGGPLLLLEPLGEAAEAGPSMLAAEADAFGDLRRRKTLRLVKALTDGFRRAAGPYLHKASLQAFAAPASSGFREGVASAGLRRAVEALEASLQRLSAVLDAVLFRAAWKGAASSLSLFLFNVVAADAFFSPQGAQQLAADVAALAEAFRRFSAKPGAHLRELTEAAALLTADEQTAASAARQLAAGAGEAALAPLGVSRLTPHQAARVLSRRV